MEKVSLASPVRLQTSSRLKRSFERVKAQVDVDLLHFRRDLVIVLGSTTDEEGTSVLRRYVTQAHRDNSVGQIASRMQCPQSAFLGWRSWHLQ
jgi:hypothetical protein